MTITAFNNLESGQRKALLKQCCGSSAWVNRMMKTHLAEDLSNLLEHAREKWHECNEDDWKEAFCHHPKIGDIDALRRKFSSDKFAGKEQSSINEASEKSLELLAKGNKRYEEKFGYIFIVCASGKSAEEMLDILNKRLENTPEEEIKIAMEEQGKITKLRLQKLFESDGM